MNENERLISLLSIFSSVPEKDIEVFLKNHSIIDLLTKPYLITDNKECIKNIKSINELCKYIDIGLRDIGKDTYASDVYNYLIEYADATDKEQMIAVFLNDSKQIIDYKITSVGAINKTLVDSNEIVKQSLLHNASNVVLVHNHPSGNLNPSLNDLNMTNVMNVALGLAGINLIDHIIMSKNGFTSLKDEGEIKKVNLNSLNITNDKLNIAAEIKQDFNSNKINDYDHKIWKNEKQEKRFIELFSKFTNITQKEIKEEIKKNNIQSLLKKNPKTKEFNELYTILNENKYDFKKNITGYDEFYRQLKNDTQYDKNKDSYIVAFLNGANNIVIIDYMDELDSKKILKNTILNDTCSIILAKNNFNDSPTKIINNYIYMSKDKENLLKITSALSLADISILDMIIIRPNDLISLNEQNLLPKNLIGVNNLIKEKKIMPIEHEEKGKKNKELKNKTQDKDVRGR